MTDYKRGTKVRLKPFGVEVTIVERYDGPHYQVRAEDGREFTIDQRVFELIEPEYGPSVDPVGTVRGPDEAGDSAVKIRDNEWRFVRDEQGEGSWSFPDDEMENYPISGVVPGTPAAAVQPSRPLWSGTGEPPAEVNAVVDRDGDIAIRCSKGGWRWICSNLQGFDLSEPISGSGWSWDPDRYGNCAPFTEVR